MLGDPSAVKEAEAMMNDPEFKSEINQYMETLKNNSAFRDAMAEAQRKYQVRPSHLLVAENPSFCFAVLGVESLDRALLLVGHSLPCAILCRVSHMNEHVYSYYVVSPKHLFFATDAVIP